MTMDVDTLQAQLRAQGLWRDSQGQGLRSTPWYVRAVLGFSAWLAACLLLPLVGVLLLDAVQDSPFAVWVAALACCALAIPLLRASQGDFLPQLGSALSLAGLMLVVIEGVFSNDSGWLAIGLLAGVMYAVGPVLIHRYLSASVLAVALITGLDNPFASGNWPDSGVAGVVMAWLAALYWCVLLRWDQARLRVLDPLAWVFTLVALVLAWDMPAATVSLWIRPDAAAMRLASLVPTLLCAILPAVVWGWSSRRVRADAHAWLAYRTGIALVLLGLVPVWLAAPGIALGLAWLILGFALARPALLGLGVVAILFYLAGYYYQLDTTLLQKALWLAVAGLVLLACGKFLGALHGRSR